MTTDMTFGGRLKAPVLVAPMFLVSSPSMALSACACGLIGSFPAHSTRTVEIFEEWLIEMQEGISQLQEQGLQPAPFAVNLVVNPTNPRYEGDLELCIKHKIEVVLTSKGAPTDVFEKIHDYGGIAFHDVASCRHAEKALEAGADGIIAVCNGAGGHTGQLNPFALVREIREITDKPLVLAGGISSGHDVAVAQAMGADMAYIGTRFLAADEAISPDAYKQMVIDSSAKDIFYTSALDGFPITVLVPSLANAGLSVEKLERARAEEKINAEQMKSRFKTVWSAGHGVGSVTRSESTAEICLQISTEYAAARKSISQQLASEL